MNGNLGGANGMNDDSMNDSFWNYIVITIS